MNDLTELTGHEIVAITSVATQASRQFRVGSPSHTTLTGIVAKLEKLDLMKIHRLVEHDVETEEAIRVDGRAYCPECTKAYWRHPTSHPDIPTLRRGCDGKLLKI